MAANIRIVKLSLRRRAEQVAVDLRRHIAITINGAVDEFDFEGVELLAFTVQKEVAERRVGMDRLTRNSGGDLALFCRPCGAER